MTKTKKIRGGEICINRENLKANYHYADSKSCYNDHKDYLGPMCRLSVWHACKHFDKKGGKKRKSRKLRKSTKTKKSTRTKKYRKTRTRRKN